MNSMTGFGRAEYNSRLGYFVIEISTVNSRFLDIYMRLPRPFTSLEVNLRELISTKINRGKLNLNLEFKENPVTSSREYVDFELARVFHKQLATLKKKLNLSGDISISDILILPEIVQAPDGEYDLTKAWVAVKKVTNQAIVDLLAMRKREGQGLQRDIKKRLDRMKKHIDVVKTKTSQSVKIYKDKLNSRIKELVESTQIDQVRLEEEIVIFADKSDITEEITRFKIHLDQFYRALKLKDPIGKKLNFILQEMNREINTIGAKCSEFSISTEVIYLKEEIEKLREQVQNVE